MTDSALLAKKLAQIETYVQQLRDMGRPDAMREDLREQRFIVYTLQIAVQCALDVASHVVSDKRLGEPETNRELFELLERDGWFGPDLAAHLANMAGFRNVLVHAYADINLDIVEDVLENHLDDLIAFTAAVRSRMA